MKHSFQKYRDKPNPKELKYSIPKSCFIVELTDNEIIMAQKMEKAMDLKTMIKKKKMERMMGFEPTTSTLARLRSTPELHPLD